MRKIAFWASYLVSAFLLVQSMRLNYPLGYHTNAFFYAITIAIFLVCLPEDYVPILQKWFKGCLVVLGLLFLVTFGLPVWAAIEIFDFDDETVFNDAKYRIVITSSPPYSGGQSTFAILKKEGIREFCIYRAFGFPDRSNPKVFEKNGWPVLIQDLDEQGRHNLNSLSIPDWKRTFGRH